MVSLVVFTKNEKGGERGVLFLNRSRKHVGLVPISVLEVSCGGHHDRDGGLTAGKGG